MAQESVERRKREERAGDELAAKLDALSRPLAERILGRAIELDAEVQAEAELVDYEMLRDIALEVGISEDALKRAILEELETERDHNARPIERVTVPDQVRGGILVEGVVDEILDRIRDHLRQQGLRETRDEATVIEWTGDAPWGTRVLRTWTVPQREPTRHLVAVDEDLRPARRSVWRWVIGLFILAALFGSPFGGLIGLGIFVAGVAAVAGWLRRTARRARRTVNRALGAIAEAREDGEPVDWLDVWERTQGRR